MSGPIDQELASLKLVADVVDQEITVAMLRHDSSGLERLRLRLVALMDRARTCTPLRDLAQREIDLEHRWWITAVVELLPAECISVLVSALQGSAASDARDSHVLDPWAALDPMTCRLRYEMTQERISSASEIVIKECRAYERTHRTSHLLDAVRKMEETVALELQRSGSSGLSADNCQRERDRVGDALRRALPPAAFRFFATAVRSHIARELDEFSGTSGARARAGDQWLSRKSWTTRADGEDRAAGAFFVDEGFQLAFEQQMEGEQRAEVDDRNRREAAEERLRQWTASRTAGSEPQPRQPDVAPLPEPPSAPAASPIPPQTERLVLVQLPDGPKWLHPAMAAACEAELARRLVLQGLKEQRYRDRIEYHGLIGKRMD